MRQTIGWGLLVLYWIVCIWSVAQSGHVLMLLMLLFTPPVGVLVLLLNSLIYSTGFAIIEIAFLAFCIYLIAKED